MHLFKNFTCYMPESGNTETKRRELSRERAQGSVGDRRRGRSLWYAGRNWSPRGLLWQPARERPHMPHTASSAPETLRVSKILQCYPGRTDNRGSDASLCRNLEAEKCPEFWRMVRKPVCVAGLGIPAVREGRWRARPLTHDGFAPRRRCHCSSLTDKPNHLVLH